MSNPPVERVIAYIAAYHQKWSELYERVSDGGDFDAWAVAMAEVANDHCTPDGNEMDRYSIGSPPAHDPGEEVVLDHEMEGDDQAIVLTQCGDYRYFQYELQNIDGQWRIARMTQTAADPREPMIDPHKLEELLNQATTSVEWRPVGEQDDPTNALFEEGRLIELESDSGTLTVRRIGELNVTSGVLAVQDFGYDAYGLAPLERRVAPGRYPVEVSSVFGRNAAMRVLFGDPNDVVAWHPAYLVDGGYVRGVDAGNLAVFDMASFRNLDVRTKERVYEDKVVNPESFPAAEMMTLEHPDDGAVAHSGWGDGAYPVHWGVDSAGEPVVLLLDFLVACRWPTETAEIEIRERSPGKLEHELLRDNDVVITMDVDGEGPWMTVDGDVSELKIIDDAGEEISNVKWLGSRWSNGIATYELPPEVLDELPWRLRVGIGKGYRND